MITDAHSDERFRVLDLHHHLGPDEGARATDPRSTTAVFPERVAIMDRFGVDQAVLMPPNSASGGPSMTPANDHVAAAVRRDPARFPAGVARIDLAEGLTAARAELHRAVSELGLRGAVWHHRFQGVFLDHPDMPELARICGTLGIPAFIHVIEGSSLESPWRLERILESAPDVAVVALDAFSSWDRAGEMTAIAGRHDNLWCELGALSAVAGNHVERYVESVGPERLLLGTDLFMSGGRSMTYQVPFAVLEVVHLNLDPSGQARDPLRQRGPPARAASVNPARECGPAMIDQIRAVVTSIGADGSSLFESAAAVDPTAYTGGGGVEQWSVWGTADRIGILGDATIAAVHAPPFPGEGGTRFFVVRLPAGFSGAFHTTDTIDYGVVIEGEIVLDLGDGGREVLPAGTCIVQRGTSHAWRNETTEPALVAFVIVGARRPT